MNIDRSAKRNIHFYDASTPGVILGGFRQHGSVTEANFLDMLGILLITSAPIRVQERTSGHVVATTNNPLQPGEYDVYCGGRITVTDEQWEMRLLSHSVSGRDNNFRDGIRARDGKCVISGEVNDDADINDWTGFESAHVFPLKSESIWIANNYARWITDMDNTVGDIKINSCQNGLLLRRDLYVRFNNYLFTVNPDDNYKIVVFGSNSARLDGRTLDPVCRDPADPHRVSDNLLRWHFRQAVLANMKGAGEPIFEYDFPPGTDMMRAIREGPNAKDRFEIELMARLRNFVQS